MKKYEITDIAHPDNPNLHRIRAVTDLTEDVLAGMLGGYVESRDNLDQAGRAWISADAIACEMQLSAGMQSLQITPLQRAALMSERTPP